MPHIAAVSKIDLPHKIEQQKVKEYAKNIFSTDFPQIDRIIDAFDHTEIKFRNFCQSLDYYAEGKNFQIHNDEYVRISLEYSIQAVEKSMKLAKVNKNEITDFIFISSTGLATPSLDALIINKMQLNPHISRTPVFGLGCGGGVSGIAKANAIAKGNPEAVVLIVAVELCSLTFLKNDYSKSNFIASSLFSDGIVACIIKGDSHPFIHPVKIIGSSSKLYYDSLDIMGWEFLDTGFKAIFSKDIPTFIHTNIRKDIDDFLSKYNLMLGDIKNFIFHPGGKKVINAYEEVLEMKENALKNTCHIMNEYGNMSSATVLYVLEKFLTDGFENGYGLMVAMGPGFSSEMVLLDMNKN